MKEIRIKNVELDFTNHFLPEHTDVRFNATVIIEIDEETGEKVVTGAIAEETNEVFGVKEGEWFDVEDSIDIEELEAEIEDVKN